jgi:hypothetical protein
MQPFPLLHALDAAATVTTVDWWVVGLGALALAVAVTLIWRIDRRIGRRGRRRALHGAAAAVAALALLPSLFPYDHVIAVSADHGHGDAAMVHASHCHGSPESCADAPVTAGPGQLLGSGELLVPVALVAMVLLLPVAVMRGVTRRPPTPPPLGLSAA